ncbi:MAG: hypothetical protein CSB44_12980 [Gammaproteobacteria bacterium]|nr:MAG: hypothetical protein CSB44_12980 [Gammaproteobacteria bacterium]
MLKPDNLALPVIAAPMFLVSGPDLLVAACKAGIVGTLPALNQRSSEGFEAWLDTVESSLAGVEHPGYGINLIVHKSNPRLEADLAICEQHRVPLIITSLGAVPELVARVHAWGGLVFHDVINLRHARKAAEAGVDGLIAVSAGAGGHAGTLHPFALLHEIRAFFDGKVILSGALSNGADVAAACAAGADYAYMGTRFIATKESQAGDDYRRMVIDSTAADIVYTDSVSGVAANFLQPSIENAGVDLPDRSGGHEIDFGKELTAPEDAKAWKDIWSAGQGVGSIDDVPTVAELVARMQGEFADAAGRLSHWAAKRVPNQVHEPDA